METRQREKDYEDRLGRSSVAWDRKRQDALSAYGAKGLFAYLTNNVRE